MEDMTDSCKEINSKVSNGRGVRLWQITIFLILFPVVMIYAAEYLDYCDPPKKADVVVLFLGPEISERSREAAQLIKDGYADNLFVPAYEIKRNGTTYPDYYEDTHIEILRTIKMMEKEGYETAIMVSSPYHMRRIRMISNLVFSDMPYQLTFRGSRYVELKPHWITRIKRIIGEYIKMVFFVIYHFYETVNSMI
ncbi:conserved hypothetical protein [Desulfamplus magnetovallimortis]|uniref:DUF218 domain-containing protein n=1 Tax=Desulfamplus magnetovallimortis TaxID=1246637 RepID=A0A1W1H8I1_9BACT|nr:hypothetical protein [Desulfamplus magnetovallimortis]SLM28688.1 conserved hypothetical protein [Desulfamplus magnetovallimortis]